MKALHSIAHSFLQHLLKLHLRDAVTNIWFAARGILRALWALAGPRDGLDTTHLRDQHCQDCPMFDERWKTCGTPGDLAGVAPPIKLGCWCYLPLANRDPKKDCWARAHELNTVAGWPDELRPTK